MCDQQRLRPACAYAQSDQSLCLSLDYYMIVKLLTERHLEFLSLKRGCTGSSESTHVKMPHCWKSHVTAHIITYINLEIHLTGVPVEHTNIAVSSTSKEESSIAVCFLLFSVPITFLPILSFYSCLDTLGGYTTLYGIPRVSFQTNFYHILIH